MTNEELGKLVRSCFMFDDQVNDDAIRETISRLANWELAGAPHEDIEFYDDLEIRRVISWDEGDPSVGIDAGYVLVDDEEEE